MPVCIAFIGNSVFSIMQRNTNQTDMNQPVSSNHCLGKIYYCVTLTSAELPKVYSSKQSFCSFAKFCLSKFTQCLFYVYSVLPMFSLSSINTVLPLLPASNERTSSSSQYTTIPACLCYFKSQFK